MKLILFLISCFTMYKLINKYINLFIIGFLICLYFYKPSLIYDFMLLIYNTYSNTRRQYNRQDNRQYNRQDNRQDNKKRNVSESMKKLVASKQLWKCSNCDCVLDATYEVDHTKPLYKGGGNEIENLTAMCRNCHGKKTLMDKLAK
jgi:hypothetical protein